MHVHYILPIRRHSYDNIESMIRAGLIKHAPGARLQHNRLSGNLFVPMTDLSLTALSDTAAQVGPHQIAADIYRLPSSEYSAVVRSSPDYVQERELNDILLKYLNIPHNLVQAGHQQLVLPRELSFTASWLKRWSLLRRCQEWFLVLWFDLQSTNIHNRSSVQTEAALDLGADPLVWVADSANMLTHLERPRCTLPAQVQRQLALNSQLRERVEFELLRSDALGFTWLLVHMACVVYLEDLTYNDMDRRFVGWARRTGLLDWHECWLPNRLAVMGVVMEKVDPRGTSQRCSLCHYPHGHRHRDQFTCPNCGMGMNAHANAAQNILERGQAKAAQWRAANGNCSGGVA